MPRPEATVEPESILPTLLDLQCRVCGCTQYNACVDGIGEMCSWAQRDLCTFCEEVGAQIRAAYGSGSENHDGEEPLVQLYTEGDLRRMTE